MPCLERSLVAWPSYGVMPSSMRPALMRSFPFERSSRYARASGAFMWASWIVVRPQLRSRSSTSGQFSTMISTDSSGDGVGILPLTRFIAAISSSLPVGSPESSFSMFALGGWGVSLVMPAISRAVLLATALWPPARPR